MKVHYLTSLLLAVLASVTSCEDSVSQGSMSTRSIPVLEQAKDQIPLGHDLLRKMNRHGFHWHALDAYYRAELQLESDSLYYPALQWVTLQYLAESNSYMNQAPRATKVFYLKELMQTHFVPDPGVAYALLAGQDSLRPLETPEIYNFIVDIREDNRQRLTPPEFIRHDSMYFMDYQNLESLITFSD